MPKHSHHTRKILFLLILMATTLLPGGPRVEATDDPTPAKFPPWALFGEVTMNSSLPEKDEPIFIRFVIFDNWDLLIELHTASSIKKTLQLPSPATSLYSGLTEAELSSSAKNPFMFFDMALAPVLGPLNAAFPKGIDQLPFAETSFSTIWERRQFHGVVVRTSADVIRYDITLRDGSSGQSARFHGTWKSTKPPALPDEFSLRGWQLRPSTAGVTTPNFVTLGEARKSHTPMKP